MITDAKFLKERVGLPNFSKLRDDGGCVKWKSLL